MLRRIRCDSKRTTATTDATGKVALPHANGLIALVAANLYVLAFGVSWGPTVWTMLSEIFPNRMRGSGLAVAATAQWLANWLVTVTFPIMLRSLGSAIAYLVYAIFAALAICFVLRFIRETNGRSLEDMSVAHLTDASVAARPGKLQSCTLAARRRISQRG